MGKSAGPGQCVHCLRAVDDRNWDHVLPESWYPDTTPPNLDKWKVPSCPECNRGYGKIEQDLLISFGLCLDPNKPETASIVKKALRSLKPEFGKNDRDREARQKKQEKVLRRVQKFETLPDKGIFPNFGPTHSPGPGGYIAVPLPRTQLEKLTEKIVRGIAYIEDGVVIDDSYDLDIYVVEDSGAEHFRQMIKKYGYVLNRDSAIVVHRAVVPEDPRAGIYGIEIWGQAKLYATVTPKDDDDAAANTAMESDA